MLCCLKITPVDKNNTIPCEQVEEGLAWWPGQTEEGKKMMIHAKDYNEFVKNIQVNTIFPLILQLFY